MTMAVETKAEMKAAAALTKLVLLELILVLEFGREVR